jgi:hypothetical protein
LSYDPALTLVTGGEIGLLVAIGIGPDKPEGEAA